MLRLLDELVSNQKIMLYHRMLSAYIDALASNGLFPTDCRGSR